MKGLSKEHNKSKRRRENKLALQVLRNPEKRERLVRELLVGGNTPMRTMSRTVAEWDQRGVMQ